MGERPALREVEGWARDHLQQTAAYFFRRKGEGNIEIDGAFSDYLMCDFFLGIYFFKDFI